MIWIQEGRKVRFDPFGSMVCNGSEALAGEMVTGTIDMVNWKHRWFSVVYGNNQRTSFHFIDIGQEVNIIG